ncbi:MAG: hypothetical protein IJI14_00775 [Anaerolineaceae bacterium]|nr:hypothetical protein [Anaerolineaceae bacterium]
MSKNEQFVPFSAFSFMNQTNGNSSAPIPMFQMPNIEMMNQMAFRALSQKLYQMQAYFSQMAQTGAVILSQLYMEHAVMVQQAAEQDKEMMKQFEKVLNKKDDKVVKTEKSAEKKTEKAASN